MTYKVKWTPELVRERFLQFIQEYGREPSALEIDKCTYLPSSRQIQRIYGGLPHLRRELGFKDISFAVGLNRSKIATEGNKKSRESEEFLKSDLCRHFHDPFVHVEKPIDKTKKIRLDFYIFNPQENFGVDIFTTENYRSLIVHVQLKVIKYAQFSEKLYLVLSSENLTAGDIKLLLSRKKSIVPKNIVIIHLEDFLHLVEKFPAYDNPISL